jgi:hypothetical protein
MQMVTVMNRKTVTLGVRTALVQGSIASLPTTIGVRELAVYMRATSHTRGEDFGTGPGEPTFTTLRSFPYRSFAGG